MEDLAVIIPTYNEADNISGLIGKIKEYHPEAKVLVADDGSSDGTGEKVVEVGKRKRGVIFIDRGKEREKGLAASVLHAAKIAGTEYVIVMDGDGQHPPEKIYSIYREMEKGHDVVVACRRRIPKWGAFRRLVSKVAELLGRASLKSRNAPECSDILSGYFGCRRFILTNVAFEENYAKGGFKVLFDMMKQLEKGRWKIGEVGYVFRSRDHGKSKIRTKHILLYLKSILT